MGWRAGQRHGQGDGRPRQRGERARARERERTRSAVPLAFDLDRQLRDLTHSGHINIPLCRQRRWSSARGRHPPATPGDSTDLTLAWPCSLQPNLSAALIAHPRALPRLERFRGRSASNTPHCCQPHPDRHRACSTPRPRRGPYKALHCCLFQKVAPIVAAAHLCTSPPRPAPAPKSPNRRNASLRTEPRKSRCSRAA
jgi:hypothetical protein